MKRFKVPAIVRWIFFRRTWALKSTDSVCLTFDDGPTEGLTDWILDLLKEQNIKATFFCVGVNVEKQNDSYKRILSEGHELGNHTFSHEKGTEVDYSTYLSSINKAHKLLSTDLFRPPYGRLPISYARKLRRSYTLVMWSWLSYDYDNTVSIEAILASAEKDIVAGDILVLHDNIKANDRLKLILPQLIEIIQKKGLKFRLISV